MIREVNKGLRIRWKLAEHIVHLPAIWCHCGASISFSPRLYRNTERTYCLQIISCVVRVPDVCVIRLAFQVRNGFGWSIWGAWRTVLISFYLPVFFFSKYSVGTLEKFDRRWSERFLSRWAQKGLQNLYLDQNDNMFVKKECFFLLFWK